MARMPPYENLGHHCYSAERTCKLPRSWGRNDLSNLGTDKRFCLPSSIGEEGTMPSRQAPRVSQNDVGYLEVSMLEYTARRQVGHTD